MATVIPTTMTVDQARAVIWNLPDKDRRQGAYGKPLGKAFDDGLISLSDLSYAAERAYNQQLKLAAKTLYDHVSNRRQASATSDRVLNLMPSNHASFSERQQFYLAMTFGAITGIYITLIAIFIIWAIAPKPDRGTTNLDNYNTFDRLLVYALVILIMFAIYWIPLKLFSIIGDYLGDKMQLHRKGQRGEQRVLNIMYNVLDGRWWVFQNLELPGQKGDIDMVLVGPQGVYSLEIKAFSAEHRNVVKKWERRFYRQWLPAFKDPGKQARRNAATLKHILTQHGINWVEPIIVWANPEAKLTTENPFTPIWQLDQISQELPKLTGKQPLSEEQRNKIVEILKGLYKEPFAAEQA